MLFAALKDKKNSHDDNEGKSAFHAIAIELYKQKKTNKKRTSIKVGVVSRVLEQLTVVLLVS